jgi:hypothetical protein
MAVSGDREALPTIGFWPQIKAVDEWLDAGVADHFKDQPLAQDWARVAKIAEEAGEAIAELILSTGQNPRKPLDSEAGARMLHEMADVALTAILGIQHFTKDVGATRRIVERRMERIWGRATNV